MSSKRVYRRESSDLRLCFFSVKVKETDLWVAVDRNAYHEELPSIIEQLVYKERKSLENYLKQYPHFMSNLKPCVLEGNPPELFRLMIRAANQAGVGPMAAVAGAFADLVGVYLKDLAREVVVENGGDIYLKAVEPLYVGIYAGNSELSGKLALKITPGQTPLGVCTSSGLVGPSLSFGRADAAVALSPSVPLADACATALGNMVKTASDLEPALNYAEKIQGITGAVIICEGKVAAWGDIELVSTS